MTLERSVFNMARKTKAKSTAIETIGEGAGYYRYRYLMGAMQQAMMIATVRQARIKEDVHRMPEITTAWRAASMKMVELTAQEEGIADQVEITDLPEDVQARAVEIGADPLFQASFSSVPFAIKVVEIDKLVAPQREVNLDYAKSLHTSIPGKEINDILEFCVGPRKAPELRMLQTAMNQMTFSSRSLDLRFLGGYPNSITKDDISVAHAGGKPAEATVLLVGFGADPINAFHVNNRVVLNNGFHRVFALRSKGVTKIPIVLQEVVNADIEFPDSLIGLSRVYLLQSARPVIIKDFFDDELVTEVRLKPRRKVVKVSWGVEDSVVPE
jgi:hypothetical protein